MRVGAENIPQGVRNVPLKVGRPLPPAVPLGVRCGCGNLPRAGKDATPLGEGRSRKHPTRGQKRPTKGRETVTSSCPTRGEVQMRKLT